jgi:hypothetical protein
MKILFKIWFLVIFLVGLGKADSWSMKINRHGVVLESSKSTLYLGKDCDAISTKYGDGIWGLDNKKVSVVFEDKKYSLNIGLAYPQLKCYNPKLISENYNPQHVEVVIPHDKCALIVASRKTMQEVFDYIDENITSTRYLNIYESNNGWYAISIGFLKKSQKNYVLEKWKSVGKIPSDSLCSTGRRYLYEVPFDEKFKKALKKKIGFYTNANEVTYKPKKRTNNRILFCLAKTWGPDVCSKKFREFAKNKMNTDVNNIISSPICTTLISKILNEPISQSDIDTAILTGFLDEFANSGIKSDNIIYYFSGIFSSVLSLSVKISQYDKCISE